MIRSHRIPRLGPLQSSQPWFVMTLSALAIAVVGMGVTTRSLITILLLVGVVIAVPILLRPHLAVAAMIVSFYFDGYLAPGGQVITLGKLIGALALVAWAVAWGIGRCRLVITPHLLCLAGMAAWIGVATLVASDRTKALITDGRYAAFFIVFFLVTQVVHQRWNRVRALTSVAVLASAASAVIGLVGFAVGHVHRASGPLSGANDFGFVLSSTLPAAAWHARAASRRATRLLYYGATGFLLLTILATLSRSALVAIVAMAVWAAATRRVSLRWLAFATCAVIGCVLLVVAHPPAVLKTDLARREKVANQNIQSRLYYWDVAAREAALSPIVGVGPGNFQTKFSNVAGVFNLQKGYQTTHDAYLNILAELGFPGLGFFLAFLAYSWRDFRARRLREDEHDRGLRTALAMGFVAALVGSMFLTEQYHAPIWLLPALVATPLATSRTRIGPVLDVQPVEGGRA